MVLLLSLHIKAGLVQQVLIRCSQAVPDNLTTFFK